MRETTRTPSASCVLRSAGLALVLALTGCGNDAPPEEPFRAMRDSVQLSGDERQSLMELSNSLDTQVQPGARVDLIVAPHAGREAVAQIVLPTDTALPTSADVTAVLRGIEGSLLAAAFDWRVEAVSPTGALVSLEASALAAGVSAAHISPFGELRIEAPISQEAS